MGQAEMMCSTINSVSPVFWLDCLYITSLFLFLLFFLCGSSVQTLNIFQHTVTNRNMRSGAGVQSSFKFCHFRKGILINTLRRKNELKQCSSLSIKYHKWMFSFLNERLTDISSSFLSWLQRKWNDPLPGCGSLNAIGLYLNNQTHSVVFIMCAKCLLCYFKKLINEYKSIYITIYIQYTFFWKLCNHWLVSTPHNVIQSNNTKCYKIKTCID